MTFLLAAGFVYGLDDLSARFGIPARDRFGIVTVKRYYYINEKYNKYSIEPMPSVDQRCVNALLPHSGSTPCWYLKRHARQTIEVN